MKIVIALLSLLIGSSFAEVKPPKAIYGTDDRIDVIDALLKQRILARSVAVRINNDRLKDFSYSQSSYNLPYIPLKDLFNLCPTERFIRQSAIADCTGFLIAPDLLATAGHCVAEEKDCANNSWVFDYQIESKAQSYIQKMDQKNVYGCREVVAKTNNEPKDWAIVRLDRPVENRKALKLSNKKLKVGTSLFVIGSPSGLPLKLATGKVRAWHKDYFVTTLDSFAGNSGSPVFDEETQEVYGILVRGDADYFMTPQGCIKPSKNTEFTGRGEDASTLTELMQALKR